MDTINLDNGQTVVPDWAKEVTMKKMASDMSKLSGTIQSENEKLIKAITGGKGSNKDANDASKASKESTKTKKEETKEVKNTVKEYSKLRAASVALGVGLGGFIGTVVKGSAALAGAIAALTTDTLFRYTASLNRLTDVGLNQADEFMDTNFALRSLGMSLEEATNFTLGAAGAMQALGGDSINNLLKQFNALNANGADFGLTLQDNIDILKEEINFATRLGNIGQLDEKQRTRLIQRTEKLLETQIEYSGVLGESVETVRAFTIQLLQSQSDFQARLLMLNEDARQELIKSTQEFASVLRATGGELGGELAAAAIEAGSFGAIGFSEAAKRFVTVLPSLAGDFNRVVQGFNRGLLDGEDVALQFTETMGLLTEGEKQRIFAIARTGDAQALALAKGVMQFEKSVKKIAEAGVDLTPVEFQRTMNLLTSTGTQLITTFGAVKDKFILSFIDGIDYDAFNNSFKALRNAVTELAQTFFGIEGDQSEIAKSLGEKLPVAIDFMTVKIGLFNQKVQDFLDKNKDAGFFKTFTDVVKPALVKLFDMIAMEFGVMLHGIGLRIKSALLPFYELSEEEIQAEKDAKRDEIQTSLNQKYSLATAQGIAEREGIVKVKNDPVDPAFIGPPKKDKKDTQDIIKSRTNQYGKTTPGYLADVEGQRFLNTAGTQSSPAQIISLGSTTLNKKEQQAMDMLMKLHKEGQLSAIETNLQMQASRIPENMRGITGPDFKQSFDTDNVQGLSNEEMKTYLETLILLTRKQTKTIEQGNM